MLYLVKLKVAFTNTIFWCWISGLIHANYFYDFQLIEIKTNIQSTNMYFNTIQDFRAFFSNNIYKFCLKTCWDKIWKSSKFKKSLRFPNSNFWCLPPSSINVESGKVLTISEVIKELLMLMFWKFPTTLVKTCGDKISKSSKFKKLILFSSCKLSLLPPTYQCWIWPNFVFKTLKLSKQHWFGDRHIFTEKQIFYFVSTILFKIVGCWYYLKKKPL